jgi:hypothetical protein
LILVWILVGQSPSLIADAHADTYLSDRSLPEVLGFVLKP